MVLRGWVAALVVMSGCGHDPDTNNFGLDATVSLDGSPTCTGSHVDCAMAWEQAASNKYDGLLGDPTGLATFLKAVPKGGDLHNHLTGAVYAEQYLDWGKTDGDCVSSTSHSAVASSSCSATNVAFPTSGTLYDGTIDAWSMRNFVTGAENGHDHFFATFGKYGLVAGGHRDQTMADVLKRAADENELYVETMFNLAKNMGTLTASISTGTVTADSLSALYDSVVANAGFNTAVTNDVAVLTSARAGYMSALGCNDQSPPDGCGVGIRFVAQIARTGAADSVFGQMIGAFEMAKKSSLIVAADLSSPEDDSASISSYNLQMAMLDFLHTKYAGVSPLHITLHAGELVPAYLPTGSTANTFHIRAAVETGHAERIGHGIDINSESDPTGLMAEMAASHVAVEVCLSSNAQILLVSGTAHPLAQYIAAGVPVSLATDDQGVSRSSMAGEYQRAALDQHLTYRQLKTIARDSLAYSFLPGDALATSTACGASATMALGDPASTDCAAFLATSEKATMQWQLEHNFLAFESQQ
jgi:adenosine deaminase